MISLLVGKGNIAAGTTQYGAIQSTSSSFFTGTDTNAILCSVAGTLQDLRVQVDVAPGTGNSHVFTVRVNGSDTAITATMTDGAVTISDNAHTVSISAGDRIDLKCVTSASTSSTILRWYLKLVGSNSNEAAICGGGRSSGEVLSATATQYMGIQGLGLLEAVEADASQLITAAGTIKNLYVKLSTTTGAAKSRKFTVYKNGVATALTCTITNATTGNDTTHSFSVVAGDTLSIECVPTSSPATSGVAYACTLNPTTDGDWPLMANNKTAPSTSTTNYGYVCMDSGTQTWLTTETLRFIPFPKGTFKKFYAQLTTAPGLTKSYDFTLKNSTTATGITMNVSGLSTTGNDTTHNAAAAEGDIFEISSVPNSTPAGTGNLKWGFIFNVATLDVAQTVTAKARMKVGQTQTATSKARMKLLGNNKTCTAKARMKLSGNDKTCTAKARIKLTQTQTATSKARMKLLGNNKTCTAKARIKITGNDKTCTAKARIKVNQTKTCTAKARIKKLGQTQTCTSKARIKILAQTVTATAKARLKFNQTKTVTALAKIKVAQTKTVTAKADIFNTATKTCTAKANINNLVTITIDARGRIKVAGNNKTMTARAYIKVVQSKTCTSKARMLVNQAKTMTAKARLKLLGQIQTVSALARVKQAGLTKTVTAKARIKMQELGVILGIHRNTNVIGGTKSLLLGIHRNTNFVVGTKL